MTPALALRDVHKSFGPIEVLYDIDFALIPGEVHALIGENGAGKSTIMKILGGLSRADIGRCAFWTANPSPIVPAPRPRRNASSSSIRNSTSPPTLR